MLLLCAVGGVSTAWADDVVEMLTPSVDGWIRETDVSAQNYSSNSYEIKHNSFTKSGESTPTQQDFQAVLKFDIPSKAGYRIKALSLRLVTQKSAAKTAMEIYQLGTDIASGNTFSTLSSAITTARAGSPIGTFTIAQQVRSKQLGTDALGLAAGTEFDLSKWTNTISLATSGVTPGASLNLFLTIGVSQDRDTSEGSVNKFFSSRATDLTSNVPSTISKEDIVPQLTVTYEEDTDYQIMVKTPAMDTWLRYNNTTDHSSETTMELKTYATSSIDFVGYMSFDYSVPAGYELQSATLRIVSAQIKGDRTLNFYAFNANVPSDATYATYADAITAAKATTAVGTVELEGQNGKAITTDNVDAAKYQTITAWQNTVDLTAFIKSQTGKFGLLLARDDADNSNKIFTSEATGISNYNCNYFNSCTASDLVPQLTLVFKKVDSYTLTVGDAKAATLVLPFDATIPSGVKAYKLSYEAEASAAVAMEVTGGTLEANTPVLINTEEATTYTFTRTGDAVSAAATPKVGALVGNYAADFYAPQNSYILYYSASKPLGFYKVTKDNTNKIAPYRAYLTTGSLDAGAASLSIIFDNANDNTTGLSEKVEVNVEKLAAPVFNLSGQRVMNPTKGLYIVNGKKYVVK